MRVGFTADEVGFDDEYALVCGVAGEGKSLVLRITAEEYAALRRNLLTIFRGSLHLLTAD